MLNNIRLCDSHNINAGSVPPRRGSPNTFQITEKPLGTQAARRPWSGQATRAPRNAHASLKGIGRCCCAARNGKSPGSKKWTKSTHMHENKTLLLRSKKWKKSTQKR
jgi:hypothetical protein